jgi:enoyl-CoA hydratase
VIRKSRAAGVLTLTIDRPEKKNALTVAMRQVLEGLPTEVNDDPQVSVVVLAAVDPVFSAGADLAEIAAADGLTPTDPGAGLRAITKPTIAAVNGACVTGGLELALSCDFIVASDQARFRDTHVALGVLPRWGMSALLPRRVGLARAKEISLSGRWVHAAEAERIGLANSVVPHAEFADAIAELAARIAAHPDRATAATLALLDQGEPLGLTEALELEAEVSGAFEVDASELWSG